MEENKDKKAENSGKLQLKKTFNKLANKAKLFSWKN